jgi:hypothetical protein
VHARLNGRAALAAFVLVAASVVTTVVQAPVAQAASGTSSCSAGSSGGTSGGGGGSVAGGTVTMWQMLSTTKDLCPENTSSNSGDANYTPPQCWWGPEYDPAGLAADIGQLDTNGGSAIDTYTALTEEYAHSGTGATYPANYQSTDGPPWELFNVGAKPPGEWWGLIWSDTITMQGMEDCTAIDTKHFPYDWYWVVDTAPTPGDAPVLDAYQLALYVQGKVDLPALPVTTNPDLAANTKATVGLPTWVWADAAGSQIGDTITTKAEYGSLQVQMTATASSFSLSTDDPGATVYSDCKRNADGTVGTAYTGQSGNPPCGVTFSQPGTWNLTMQTTWNVVIDYGTGQLTATGTSETQIPASVQEVQAINE